MGETQRSLAWWNLGEANKSVFCCWNMYQRILFYLAKHGLFEFQCQHALFIFVRFPIGLHTVNMMRDSKGYKRIWCWFRFTKLIQTMYCVYLHRKYRWGLYSRSSILSRVLKPCLIVLRAAVLGICSTLISIFVPFPKLALLDWFSSSHPVPVATRPHQSRWLHVF